MTNPMRRLLPFLLALLASPLAAQRELTTIGTFADADGEPVPAATVTFATSPQGVYDAFAPTTVVTVMTDDRGRFRARLRTGVAYSAWAVGSRQLGKGLTCSRVVEGVIAGNVVELRATGQTPRSALKVSEVAGLGDGGPFTARIRIDARHGSPVSAPIAADGTIELPPLPDGPLHVRILNAAGKVVVASANAIGKSVSFAVAREYRFVVRDASGAPLEGARVAFANSDYVGAGNEPFLRRRTWHALVESEPTDAGGRTSLAVRDHAVVFMASAEGHAMTISGVMNGEWVANGQFAKEQPTFGDWPRDIGFTLQPATTLSGRVHDGGTARAGAGLRLATRLQVTKRDFGVITASIDHARDFRTDPEGRFRIDVPGPATDLQLWLAPGAGDAQQFLFFPRQQAHAAPVDIDLATWPLVTMQILDGDGGPPPHAQVVLLPGGSAWEGTDPIVLHANRAGRVEARLEQGSWFAFATDGAGWHARSIPLVSAADQLLEMRLEPLARMSGRVIDAAGEPVAAARFRFGGRESRRLEADITPVEGLLRHYSMMLNNGLIDPLRTAADGTFEIRFVDIDGVTHVGNVARQGSPRVTLRAEADVTLQLTK